MIAETTPIMIRRIASTILSRRCRSGRTSRERMPSAIENSAPSEPKAAASQILLTSMNELIMFGTCPVAFAAEISMNPTNTTTAQIVALIR